MRPYLPVGSWSMLITYTYGRMRIHTQLRYEGINVDFQWTFGVVLLTTMCWDRMFYHCAWPVQCTNSNSLWNWVAWSAAWRCPIRDTKLNVGVSRCCISQSVDGSCRIIYMATQITRLKPPGLLPLGTSQDARWCYWNSERSCTTAAHWKWLCNSAEWGE